MKSLVCLSAFLLCVYKYEVSSLNLPGPMVYVVTPSPRPLNSDVGRSAPFYYNNWMRRMDQPRNATSTTTTTTPRSKTPDLIFAEFESGHNNMKSIRKLLEQESVVPRTTTTTTSRPIYVPDEDNDDVTHVVNYGLPVKTEKDGEAPAASDTTDYFAMYNKLYNNAPAPVYLPSTLPSTTTTTTTSSTTTPSTTTTSLPQMNVENIWHIIDNQKYDQYSGKWEEETVDSENTSNTDSEMKPNVIEENKENDEGNGVIDYNFALPGFGTNPGNGAENESRAIRTEPNIRFPYVNLKPFQMKSLKRPVLNALANSKKSNNMLTSLDNFREIKNPVRGEAQDVPMSGPVRQPIDRYNPAQPYLPQPDYGSKSKQSNPIPPATKVVANLVPPPPPPPKISGDDFPPPTNYESFPPYAPAGPASIPARPPPPPPAPKPQPAVTMYQPPVDVSDDSNDSGLDSPPSEDDGPPMDLGYRYKQPSPSVNFLPTLLPPLKKPFSGYSYDKPSMTVNSPPPMDDEPKYHGYHYNMPVAPSAPDHPPTSYGDHGHGHHHDSDYPELLFDNHHGMGDTKGGDDSKDSDMGMVPPPPPDMKPDHGSPMEDSPPMDDHGFPHDFPGDLKFQHDFDDDHDHHPHYHYHKPTTTTTTEMPRVNRYSYYYLGKKLYYLPLYFSVYFIVYVGALIIKAVLRHKIVYPNSWRPNDTTSSFFSKRSVDSWDLHEITGKVTHAIATAAQKYINEKYKED